MFFLLVGAGGLISFCRIRRHIRVMFSTTTGVLMFTAIKKRLRAESRGQGFNAINEYAVRLRKSLEEVLLPYTQIKRVFNRRQDLISFG